MLIAHTDTDTDTDTDIDTDAEYEYADVDVDADRARESRVRSQIVQDSRKLLTCKSTTVAFTVYRLKFTCQPQCTFYYDLRYCVMCD